METVNLELIKRVFLHINRTEKQAELLPDRQKWSKLTSALYTLEDSTNAVGYYIDSAYPSDYRGKYLFTYGLFQAIVLQQDSVKSISYALFNKTIDFKSKYPYAYRVRELRNDTTGHPTNRDGDKQFIRLAQNSLNKYSFYYCKDKVIAFYASSFLLFLFYWYLISAFCAVYDNTQRIFLTDSIMQEKRHY